MRKRLRAPDHFGRLLVLLVVDLVVSGFHDSPVMDLVNGSVALATVVVAVTVTGLRDRLPRWQIAAVLALATLALVLRVFHGEIPRGLAASIGAVALAFLTMAAMREVLDYEEVELQTLFGAMCVYLLIGLFFANVYSALDAISSDPVFHATGPLDATYFSFTTLTTVGYGDITAIGALARRAALIEGIAGQVFLATMVARLVSLYRGPKQRAQDSGS